jgi:hypothetical protein
VDLQRAELRATSFAGARAYETHLEDTNLFASDWRGSMAMNSRFDRAYLADAHLEGADFYPLKPGSLSGVGWSGAFLDRTRIQLEQLGEAMPEEVEARTLAREARLRGSSEPEVIWLPSEDRAELYRRARETYQLLKNNFNSIGRYRDASWAYQKERRMERERLWSALTPRNPRTWGNLGSWLANMVQWAVTGYGERPWRTALVAAGTIALFAGIYDGLNLINSNVDSVARTTGDVCFWDALLYSGAAFFTGGFGAMVPVNRLAGWLTVGESAIGITLLALLIFTLGNRISRS